MSGEHQMARATLEDARVTFLDEVGEISIDEALDAAGGFRSVLGLIKHTAGWTEVYRSYAFDEQPRHWGATDWPRGLRETIEPSESYVRDVLSWFERTSQTWIDSIHDGVALDGERRVHWGGTWPLRDIVASVAGHWSYHAGEINLILAVRRGEAWEHGEHVEENHIRTLGHSVRRPWMSDDYVRSAEAELRNAGSER